jgi:DNA-binding NtrC family response regulator
MGHLPEVGYVVTGEEETMRAKASALEVILANGNGEDRSSLEGVLAGTPWVIVDADPPEIEHVVREAAVPIVICDRDRSDGWRTTIRALIKARRDVCVIVLSSEADSHLNDEVVRCGAFDLLTRPFKRQQVLPMLLFAYTFCRGHGPFLRARRLRPAS